MNLLVPAALAFSAIIPIILLFYFMRPKRQERVVGSTLIWKQALQDIQASHPWQRLRITPLLLLQLLAAIVIVLILARPAIFAASPISGNTIIILQTSASMQATDVAPTRFESAKNTIADLIDSIGPGDHLSLITMARTPQVLVAQSQDKGQLFAALQRARVTNQDADLQQALSLATSLATGEPNVQIMVIGDGHVMNSDQAIATPFPVHYMSVGTDAPNVALMTLASRNINNQLTAFAEIVNFSHQQRSIPVELYADDNLVGVQTITLSAGASGSLEWSPLKANTRVLHAHLISQDPMTTDHEAWAIVGSSVNALVLLVTKGNTFLETALALQPNIKLFEITPDKYSSTIGNYDLTIFDGMAPLHPPSGNILFVNPPDGTYAFGASEKQTSISHISTGTDPFNLLTSVDLSNIHVVHAAHRLQPALWAQTIIAATETPLLIAGENNNRRIAALGFDLHVSDLPLQPAFPILMHNLANWFLPPPVPENAQLVPGVPLTVQVWPGADRVTITGPDKQVTAVGPPFPVTPYTKTDTVGLYHVMQTVQGRTLNGTFAINLFNAGQSRLAPARGLPIIHGTNMTSGGSAVPRQLREIWPWIAAFLLLILCVEWWLFSRSYKIQTSLSQRAGGHNLARGNFLQRTPVKNAWVAATQERVQKCYTIIKKRARKAVKRVKKYGVIQDRSNR
jgi:Ca-activated chloride channel family protein